MNKLNSGVFQFLGILALLTALSLLIPHVQVIPNSIELENPGESALGLYVKLMDWISKLDIFVLGAAAAVFVKGREWKCDWTELDTTLTILSFLSTSVSMYGIYLSYITLIGHTVSGQLGYSDPQLGWGVGISYFGLMTAVVLLGVVFIRTMGSRD